MKVPSRRLAGLRGEGAKERVRVGADNRCLGKYWKRDAVIHPAKLRDLLVRSGFLATEVVGGKTEHGEAFVAIAAI